MRFHPTPYTLHLVTLLTPNLSNNSKSIFLVFSAWFFWDWSLPSVVDSMDMWMVENWESKVLLYPSICKYGGITRVDGGSFALERLELKILSAALSRHMQIWMSISNWRWNSKHRSRQSSGKLRIQSAALSRHMQMWVSTWVDGGLPGIVGAKMGDARHLLARESEMFPLSFWKRVLGKGASDCVRVPTFLEPLH